MPFIDEGSSEHTCWKRRMNRSCNSTARHDCRPVKAAAQLRQAAALRRTTTATTTCQSSSRRSTRPLEPHGRGEGACRRRAALLSSHCHRTARETNKRGDSCRRQLLVMHEQVGRFDEQRYLCSVAVVGPSSSEWCRDAAVGVAAALQCSGRPGELRVVRAAADAVTCSPTVRTCVQRQRPCMSACGGRCCCAEL